MASCASCSVNKEKYFEPLVIKAGGFWGMLAGVTYITLRIERTVYNLRVRCPHYPQLVMGLDTRARPVRRNQDPWLTSRLNW